MIQLEARSLLWFRRALAACVLIQVAMWVPHLSYFFSDQGPLPRALILRAVPASTQGISLHMLGGSRPFAAFLFLCLVVAALTMMGHRHTRLATATCWLLTLSALHRAPQASGSGTMLLCVWLMWATFLPGAGLALMIQVWLSAWLTAYLGPVSPLQAWLGYTAPLWLGFPHRRLRWLGIVQLAVFYALALAGGLGPLLGAVHLVPLLALIPGPTAWPGPTATPDGPGRQTRWEKLAVAGLLALTLGAAGSALGGWPLPAAAQPLVAALALQQVQGFSADGVPTFMTRLTLKNGQIYYWVENEWLRRRHLARIGHNKALGRGYARYYVRRFQIHQPQAVVTRVDLLRLAPPGAPILEAEFPMPLR